MPSDSIKVVPGRSKLRVESSNPVARGNPLRRRTSKVMLISPEEAVKLSSGLNQVALSPVSESPRRKIARTASQSPRAKTARATSESPRPTKPARASSESPRPVLAVQIPEILRPVPAVRTPEAPRPVLARPTSEPPRSIPAHSAIRLRKEIVCGLRAPSMNTTTVRQRTNPTSFHQSTDDLPPSPRALQIRSRVTQQAANDATHTVEETVGDKAEDHDATKETCQPASNERSAAELLRYRPALHPTWKGRIVDSATLPEFDCEFCAKPASYLRRKALRLSKAMPTLLEVELLPTGHILNDMFHRCPRLSDVELYLFSDEKETERSKREHAHLFEAMSTRNAMIKVNINGTELLLFSSKLLDKTSQFFLKKQCKAENYLWGFFLHKKNSQASVVPGTSYQTDKYLSDGDVVDMDIDIEYPTPNLALQLMAESQSIPSSSQVMNTEVNVPPGFENPSRRSPGKENKEVSVPPGFEKIWIPPLVTLNIHGTSNALSGLTGSAGLVRNESGKWVFGYSRCHKSISEAAAVLLAIYHGLKLLWDSGCRRIRLETTSLEVIGALTTTTKPDLFYKRKSILGLCKDVILKSWECEIHHVSNEENLCAEWLASRLDGHGIQGLVFFEYPPLGIVDLLEKDRLAAR
ncbi:hypothetical protein Bca101_014476 [Brassica carinata]